MLRTYTVSFVNVNSVKNYDLESTVVSSFVGEGKAKIPGTQMPMDRYQV